MGNIIKLLGVSRLERLRENIFKHLSAARKNPCSDGLNSEWLEIGRAIHETSTREYQPRKVPKALRQCPWIFVITELPRAFPEIEWNGESMVLLVERYIESTQKPGFESTPFTQTKREGA